VLVAGYITQEGAGCKSERNKMTILGNCINGREPFAHLSNDHYLSMLQTKFNLLI